MESARDHDRQGRSTQVAVDEGRDFVADCLCVLSGRTASESEVWRQGRFGSVVLGNAALSDDGRHIGLPPEQIDDDPSDTVLFETIRRFKGLEAPVIVLVELPDEARARGRLDALLYVALTRATSSLTVIATPELVARLQ